MPASASPADREMLQDISLLYVEDDRLTREILVDLLSKRVAQVYVASNGAEGLEAFRQHRPDIVLSDIRMPVMDGLAMAVSIKQLSPDTPIIITTAHQEAPLLMRAIEVGIDKFLVKPIAPASLYEALLVCAKPLKMARQLRDSEGKYRLMMQQATDGIFLADRDGRLLEVNPRGCRMLGFEREELLAFNMRDLVHPEHLEQVDDVIRQVFAGRPILAESRLRRKSGAYLEVEVGAGPLDGRQFMTTVRDITRRKLAQQMQRESEEKFRLITEGIGDLIALVNTQGKRLYNSPSYRQILGKVPLLGSDSFQEIHPEDRERMRELFAETIRSGVGKQACYRFLLDDGSIRHIESNASVIKDEKGAPLKVVIVSRDVTERKLAADALAASHAMFATVLDGLDALVYVADMDTYEIIFANRYAHELFGGDLAGRVCWQLLQKGQSGPCAFCSNARLLDAQGQPTGVYVWEFCNTLTQRWYQIHDQAIHWVDGRIVRMEIATDITHLKVVEEALRYSEHNLAEAQRIAHLGSWEWQVRDGMVSYSEETARILELPQAARVCSIDEFHRNTVPADRLTMLFALEDTLREARPFEVEYRTRDAAGNIRYLHSVAEVGRDAGGKPIRLIGSIQDITEHRELEETILDIGESVRRTVGQELHDGLGQHLTGLGFVAKTLEFKLSEQGLGEAADAARIVQAVTSAIDQTRTLAKGLFPVELEENGLIPALEMLAANTHIIFGIKCSFQYDNDVLIFAKDDAIHLYRIAQEAISNAIRHGQAENVAIRLMSTNNGIDLSIADDGIGIAPGMLAKVHGMGLRIMEYRAKLIGATLKIMRAPNGGTIVSIKNGKSRQ
ncbi:MAG: PAS domain S-box protein [Sulfuricella sp.]|nr:PAS domain S-box protein [Sulfuricella sp.]